MVSLDKSSEHMSFNVMMRSATWRHTDQICWGGILSFFYKVQTPAFVTIASDELPNNYDEKVPPSLLPLRSTSSDSSTQCSDSSLSECITCSNPQDVEVSSHRLLETRKQAHDQLPPSTTRKDSNHIPEYIFDSLCCSQTQLSRADFSTCESMERQDNTSFNQVDISIDLESKAIRADELEKSGDFFGAREHLEAVLDPFHDSDVPERAVAELYHKLGVVHWKLGSYDDSLHALSLALDQYRRADYATDLEDVHDASLTFLPQVLNSMGQVLLSKGDSNSAMSMLEESLHHLTAGTVSDKHNSSSQFHKCRAQTISLIGMSHEAQGNYDRAKGCYKECLLYQREHLGDRHVDVAATLNRIGSLYEKYSKYAKALKHYKRALSIYQDHARLGGSLMDVGVSLNNAGFIYYLRGEHSVALDAFTDALRIFKDIVGPRHRNVASTLHNVALTFIGQQEYRGALQMLKQVLECQRSVLGDNHSDVAITLSTIANAYEQLGKHKRAVSFYEKALHAHSSSLQPTHAHIGSSWDNLGQAHMQMGNSRKAVQCLTNAMFFYERCKSTKTTSARWHRAKVQLSSLYQHYQ